MGPISAKHGRILPKFGSFERLGQKLQQDPCASRIRDLAAFFIEKKHSKNAPHLTEGIVSGPRADVAPCREATQSTGGRGRWADRRANSTLSLFPPDPIWRLIRHHRLFELRLGLRATFSKEGKDMSSVTILIVHILNVAGCNFHSMYNLSTSIILDAVDLAN